MNESWTDAERLAAEVLATGSDEALRELLVELDRGFPAPDRPSHSSPPLSSFRDRFRRRRGPQTRRGRAMAGPSAWLDAGVLNSAVDAAVILVALLCIGVGARPLATPVADARPLLAQALEGVSLPSADVEPAPFSEVSAAQRPVATGQPISLQARTLEAAIGRYRAVADMHAGGKLPCARLRLSYEEVEEGWT
ncbi:MAG: hypothetical protein KJO06_04795, partial [Gemmatimonadetes bacterium]|nr:hypothetical protein [Gemmatimonadota bacterium]